MSHEQEKEIAVLQYRVKRYEALQKVHATIVVIMAVLIIYLVYLLHTVEVT